MAGRIAYYGNIVKDGLVLDLDAAKKDSYPGSGTVWSDISGNGNIGTLTNGPTFNNVNGGSIVFDGSNDYVNFGQILEFATGSFSLSVWMKTSYNGSAVQTIIGREKMTDPYQGYQLGFNTVTGTAPNTGKIGFNIVASPGSGVQPIRIQTSNTYNDGNWKNVVATYDGSKNVTGMLIYINGSLVSTTTSDSTITATLTNNANFEIGARDGIQQPFNGSVAYTSVYSRTLTANEVLQNYNALKGRFGL